MTLNIVSISPSLQNTNGDAENAAVLAQRARWAGLDAAIVAIEHRDDLPKTIDAVVVGSGSDSSLEPTRELLLTMLDEFRRWGTEGVPILAVGTGWELLSWGIEFTNRPSIDGLGILPGRAVPASVRATDDIVVRSPKHGLLIGYENRARAYVGAEASPLGRLMHGAGNGHGSEQEGVVMGEVIGTHLHGPVLAKNPALADSILRSITARVGLEYVRGERAAVADGFARVARDAQLDAVGLQDGPHVR